MPANGDAVSNEILTELILNHRDHAVGEIQVDDPAARRAHEMVVHVGSGIHNDGSTIARAHADLTPLDQTRRDAVNGGQR